MIDKEILDAILPVPSIEERRDEIVNELRAEGFVITNFHSGGIFHTLLMIVLRVEQEVKEFLRGYLNNSFVTHASGPWLDLKAADYSKKRKRAQKAQGFVTLSRDNAGGEAVKIPRGHVFKTTKDINGEELRFFVIEAAVLQKGAQAVDVLVEAEMEGSRYNVPEGQITRSLTFLNGVDGISNGPDWMIREGSDTEDDEGLKARTLRSWSELAARPIEDTFINAAESVPGVLFAQADCQHPRGQGTVDIIVTGTAGEATDGLLDEVREAVGQIAGPYDNILVKSSVVVPHDIEVIVTTTDASDDKAIESKVASILADLLAVRKGRKFYELTCSDVNHAIRDRYTESTNVQIVIPAQDVKLSKLACIVFTTEPIRSTLHTGGSMGAAARVGLPQALDEYGLRHTLRTGVGMSVRAELSVPEDTAQPPAATILRTGGVCTMISNLSLPKGE